MIFAQTAKPAPKNLTETKAPSCYSSYGCSGHHTRESHRTNQKGRYTR